MFKFKIPSKATSFALNSQQILQKFKSTLRSGFLEMNSDSKIITIEGNIGAGKTTLLSLIQENLEQTQILREPVCQWQAINNNPNLNLLELFYQDPKRWAYTFQTYSLYCRLKQWTEFNIVEKYAIAERSVLSDKFIFAINGMKSGLFSEIEWEIYNEYFNWLGRQLQADKINGIVYIRTSPEVCGERIIKRGREEEKNSIPLAYLQSLHDRHEEWLVDQPQYPVLQINGDIDYETNPEAQSDVLSQVKEFLQKL